LLGGDAAVAGLARFRFSPDEQGLLAPGPGLEELGEALTRHARVRLLCVTRTADAVAGANALNGLLHERLLATSAAADATADAWNGDTSPPVFLPGEPVTILRNDHARGLWNGDQGVVIRTSTEGREELGVAFPRGDGIVVHALGELTDNIGLGFALTVHKAQGSEYDRVALILPSGDGPLLTREILYTALTRARHGVVIVGNLALFALGASRKLERASGLGERLARGRPAP
jgi:exodeoxyribonuclease V alpha subunit